MKMVKRFENINKNRSELILKKYQHIRFDYWKIEFLKKCNSNK